MQKAKNSRICIVGAGAAGLSVGYHLKGRGYTSVLVLEAADRVGGKCYSVDFKGRSFDLGANYVTAAYSEIRKLARRFGAKLYTESPTIAASIAADNKITFRTPFAAITRDQHAATLLWAMVRYLWIRFRVRKIIDRPGFADVSRHPQLCVSFGDWLESNKLSALRPMFEFPITIMGYGYLDAIPAPYALKYISLATFWNLIAVGLGLPTRWPKRFVEGFQRLWIDVAAQLDVRLSTQITAIERSEQIRVHLSNADTMEFDYLVLACPLAIGALDRFLTLSAEERDLFGRVIVNPYVVTSYAIAKLRPPERIVGMWPIPRVGQPWAMTQQYADSEFVQFYTRLDDWTAESKTTVIEAVGQLVRAFGAVFPENYITYNEWSYFPHVSVDDIRSGFYDRFEALQGRSNTFYCGSLAAFELVETVVKYSRQLVDTHF
jgi:predicted NAD/FAD-binding protein